jgi:hypothetical protein
MEQRLHRMMMLRFAIILEVPRPWRYRLGVRTEDSQSSNPGSIPGSATKPCLRRNQKIPQREAFLSLVTLYLRIAFFHTTSTLPQPFRVYSENNQTAKATSSSIQIRATDFYAVRAQPENLFYPQQRSNKE